MKRRSRSPLRTRCSTTTCPAKTFAISGSPTITGFVTPNTFTNDAGGQAALATAEKSRAFIFPKASGDPLSPDPGNRRQDNVFDYVYDPRNSLGPWTITFPSYTAAAFNTAPGRQALANMGVRHAVEAGHAPGIFE